LLFNIFPNKIQTKKLEQNMKKLIVLFFFHFFIILVLQTHAFVEAAFEKKVPGITYLKNEVFDNSFCKHYLIYSGINTGYGFYGINVATNKFFLIEALDSKNRVIKKFDMSNFNTKSTFARFCTVASWLYNFNVENEDIKKKAGKNVRIYKLREKYLKKVYQNIGKYSVRDIKNCTSFTIKMVTVVPPDIWNTSLQKNNIYAIQEYSFQNK
jgi:hypothetical protein